MIWAKWKNEVGVGTPDIIYNGRSFKDSNGITHPANIFEIWSAEELERIGWYEFVPFITPNNKIIETRLYKQDGLQIVESATTRPKVVTPKVIDIENIDSEIANSDVLLGIVRMIAADKGITETDVITSIKSYITDV